MAKKRAKKPVICINLTKYSYGMIAYLPFWDINLDPNEYKLNDIEEIAKKWLKSGDYIEYRESISDGDETAISYELVSRNEVSSISVALRNNAMENETAYDTIVEWHFKD